MSNQCSGIRGKIAIGFVAVVLAGAALGSNCAGVNPVLPANQHQLIFREILTDGYQGTASCLQCHPDEGDEMLASAHWLWTGTSARIEGYETEQHGKVDLINNFCIAVPTNEGRCTQCHTGYGWKDATFDFTDATNIDCLSCHDTTGTYVKAQTTAGNPDEAVDLELVAENVGTPTRQTCGSCHYGAGGGNNVKHGDLASSLNDATFDMDVHMGSIETGGQNLSCQACHTTMNHKIAGATALHSTEGAAACEDCHGETNVHELNVLNVHLPHVACQTCHIPTFSRQVATKVEWYWDEAGEDRTDIPLQEGQPTYDKKKGRFVWAKNVAPELKWFNGKWRRMMLNVNDTYTTTPVVLAEPVGEINDLTAKLYPFKKMIGKQVADATNKIMLVPHLFGLSAGENPYWAKFDWDLACQDAAAITGQNYSGNITFVDTVMYLSINHEVAPASQARECVSCHAGGIDFDALGYTEDPWSGNGRSRTTMFD